MTLVGSIKISSGNFPGIARKVIFFFFSPSPPGVVDHVKVRAAWAQRYHSIEKASLNGRLIQEVVPMASLQSRSAGSASRYVVPVAKVSPPSFFL